MHRSSSVDFRDDSFVGLCPRVIWHSGFFEEMTGQTERIILENQSRNTYENALYTKDLVGFSGDGSWLLVTPAFHMPRAYEIFKDQGIPVIPYQPITGPVFRLMNFVGILGQGPSKLVFCCMSGSAFGSIA